MIYLQFSIVALAVLVVIFFMFVFEKFRNDVFVLLIMTAAVGLLIALIWAINGIWDYYHVSGIYTPVPLEKGGG